MIIRITNSVHIYVSWTPFCVCVANKKPPFNSARLSGGAGSYGAIQRYNGHQWKGFCRTDNAEDTLQYYYKEMGYVNGSLLDSGPR